jgi:hypothetical protein
MNQVACNQEACSQVACPMILSARCQMATRGGRGTAAGTEDQPDAPRGPDAFRADILPT